MVNAMLTRGLPGAAMPRYRSHMTPSIAHLVDTIRDKDGSVCEEYNYLVYTFGEPPVASARAYLDDVRRVALYGEATPAIMVYLQERFMQIDRLGKTGYETTWAAIS